MKNYQFVLSLLLLSLIISCSKDTVNTVVTPSPTDKVCLIQKIEFSYGSSQTFTYDDKNRVIGLRYSSYSGTETEDYTYKGKTVTVRSNKVLSTYYLNDNGFVDSILYDNPNYSNLKVIYTYNNKWEHVSKITSGSYYGRDIYTEETFQYLDGNLIKQISNNGNSTSTWDFEYYLDKVDKSQKSMEAKNFYKSSVNLLKKSTSYRVPAVPVQVYNSTYVFDSNGNVIKSIYVNSNYPNDSTNTTSYTWICK